MAGKFIVLEGMDGSGTTTQAALLASHLQRLGHRVIASAEPTSLPLGQEARRLLRMPMENDQHLLVALALCFAADRMQHVHELIAPSLERGDVVVLDRYVLSSLVYQGLHLPLSFVKEINRYALKPDLTLVLDVDATVAYERLSARRGDKDFYETPDTLRAIKDRYLACAERDALHAAVIQAQQSVESVHEQIVKIVRERLLL